MQNERRFHLCLRRWSESEHLATGANRRRQGVGSVGDEDEEAVTRRFFQRLEQRVRCPDRQAVCIVNQTDFSFAQQWFVDEVLVEIPHLLDFDLGRGRVSVRFDYDIVRMSSRGDLKAGPALAAAVLLGDPTWLFAVQGLS